MQDDGVMADVRSALQRFQDGYTARDVSALDAFMELFVPGDDAELIGIGAAVRGGNEWFQGTEAIREIVESDWTYWGDVRFDVAGAKITALGDVAWLSTSGELVQTLAFDDAVGFYIDQMKDLLLAEDAGPDDRLMEATHFGVRRLRERHKGVGHCWPLVFTAVLVRSEGDWRFHTTHWSMPVD
jgi:hypothetical protein